MSEINRNWTKGEKFGVNAAFDVMRMSPHPILIITDVLVDNIPSYECGANGDLFADALNIANKTGLTPSELLEQRNEMKDALEAALRILEAENIFGHAKLAIKDAIANAKNIEP